MQPQMQEEQKPTLETVRIPWWGGSPAPITIGSVFPQRCTKEVNWGPRGGFSTYVLEAAPRGGVSTLIVEDTGQLIMNWEARELRLAPITAKQAADSLITEWTVTGLGNKFGRPGIWICAGSEPSAEEIALNHTLQEDYFRGLVQNGNDLHAQGKSTDISDIHRRAAQWLLSTGAQALPWYPKTSFLQLKNCVACGEEILANALMCKVCQTNLMEFYLKYGLDITKDPAVANAIAASNLVNKNKAAEPMPPVNYPVVAPKMEVK